jgi:hypothetical protein
MAPGSGHHAGSCIRHKYNDLCPFCRPSHLYLEPDWWCRIGHLWRSNCPTSNKPRQQRRFRIHILHLDGNWQWFVQGYGALYGLTPNKGAVWEYLGLGPSSWIEIGGAAGNLYAGASSELFATNPAGNALWHFVTGSTWEQVLSFEAPADFAVDKDGNAYFLGDEGLLRWSGNGNGWTPILGCPGSTLYVGGFGVFAGGSSDGRLYHYIGGEVWPLMGIGGESYALSMKGCMVWVLGVPQSTNGLAPDPYGKSYKEAVPSHKLFRAHKA